VNPANWTRLFTFHELFFPGFPGWLYPNSEEHVLNWSGFKADTEEAIINLPLIYIWHRLDT
jgi:hypothetical protein